MLFTSSSDGTTVTPTTPPDNGTDRTSGADSTNGTDATATPDTSMCEFSMLAVFSVCHGMCAMSGFFCSDHILHRSHCWYCGSLCCCLFPDISSWLWSWSDRICCLPEEVQTVNRCVVCSKEEQEVTSSAGLYPLHCDTLIHM